MKKSLKNIAFLLGCLLAVLVLSGCSLTNTDSQDANANKNAPVAADTLLEDEDATEIVTADQYGQDMADVIRYPDSIRSYYAKDDGEIDIIYQTTASVQEVRDFYTNLMKEKGWGEPTGDATDYVDFEKGDKNNPEMLTVYFTPYEKQQILEYELVYTPSLTEEELAAEEADE